MDVDIAEGAVWMPSHGRLVISSRPGRWGGRRRYIDHGEGGGVGVECEGEEC